MIKLFLSAVFICMISGPCDEIPPLNQKILAFTKKQVGKKVGSGECWDLAAQALDFAGASWDHDMSFGKEIKIEKDCVFPGDIIQFEGVEIEYWEKNTFYHMDLEHHTAVIHTVKNKGDFLLAEQNTSAHGRKVSVDALRLKDIKQGTYKIYRPVN